MTYTDYYVLELREDIEDLPEGAVAVGLFSANVDDSHYYPDYEGIPGTESAYLLDATLLAVYVCFPKRATCIPTGCEHVIENILPWSGKHYDKIKVCLLTYMRKLKAASVEEARSDFFKEKFYSQEPKKISNPVSPIWKVHFSSGHKSLKFGSLEDAEIFISGGDSFAHGYMEIDMEPDYVTQVTRYSIK